MFEVDEEGLDRLDHAILRSIVTKFAGGPVGLSTLAAAVGEETDTVEDVVEPYLLQLGFLAAYAARTCCDGTGLPASRCHPARNAAAVNGFPREPHL